MKDFSHLKEMRWSITLVFTSPLLSFSLSTLLAGVSGKLISFFLRYRGLNTSVGVNKPFLSMLWHLGTHCRSMLDKCLNYPFLKLDSRLTFIAKYMVIREVSLCFLLSSFCVVTFLPLSFILLFSCFYSLTMYFVFNSFHLVIIFSFLCTTLCSSGF